MSYLLNNDFDSLQKHVSTTSSPSTSSNTRARDTRSSDGPSIVDKAARSKNSHPDKGSLADVQEGNGDNRRHEKKKPRHKNKTGGQLTKKHQKNTIENQKQESKQSSKTTKKRKDDQRRIDQDAEVPAQHLPEIGIQSSGKDRAKKDFTKRENESNENGTRKFNLPHRQARMEYKDSSSGELVSEDDSDQPGAFNVGQCSRPVRDNPTMVPGSDRLNENIERNTSTLLVAAEVVQSDVDMESQIRQRILNEAVQADVIVDERSNDTKSTAASSERSKRWRCLVAVGVVVFFVSVVVIITLLLQLRVRKEDDDDMVQGGRTGVADNSSIVEAPPAPPAPPDIPAPPVTLPPTELVSLPHVGVGYTVGPFNVNYYTELDGTVTGEGTDGSNADIESFFVASETVVYPGINYGWNSFHGINSYNFRAEWEGPLNVVGGAQAIETAFGLGHSDASFYIDDELIDEFSNDKVISLSLDEGSYNLRIIYHNHWHTVEFFASFTNYPDISAGSAMANISPLLTDDTKIACIEAYESGSTYLTITVNVPASAGPCFLFLASYSSIHWIVEGSAEIIGVAIDSYTPAISVSEPSNAPIFHITDMRSLYRYEDGESTLAAIGIPTMINRAVDYQFYDYNPTFVNVPEL